MRIRKIPKNKPGNRFFSIPGGRDLYYRILFLYQSRKNAFGIGFIACLSVVFSDLTNFLSAGRTNSGFQSASNAQEGIPLGKNAEIKSRSEPRSVERWQNSPASRNQSLQLSIYRGGCSGDFLKTAEQSACDLSHTILWRLHRLKSACNQLLEKAPPLSGGRKKQ